VVEPEKVALLIVDDETAIRKLLAKIAERAGFDVDTARDGMEALEMLGAKTYEIAIVDLMMPRLSGYELVQKISTLTPRPTVIVATALMHGDTASLDDSMVRRVIRKPFDIQTVAQALVETARQIADERAASGVTEPVVQLESLTTVSHSRTGDEPVPPLDDPSPRKPTD
jgi:DNA-binding response OmpR family regulator